MPPKDPRNIGGQRRRSKGGRKLDLAFVLDTTESQDKYITASAAKCKDVCIALQGRLDEGDGLHLAVIAYRDHNEEDEYVTKDFNGFTSSVNDTVRNLSSLTAYGGNDGPEALTAALDKVRTLKWRQDAAKVVVVITDAPPHGIGEEDDDYWDGDPDGKDPLFIVRAMKRRNIVVLFVACEPTMDAGYEVSFLDSSSTIINASFIFLPSVKFAHDFYKALAKITSGAMLPLTNADLLGPLIVGFALEQTDIGSLASDFAPLITELHEAGMSETDISKKLFELMQTRKVKVTTLQSTEVYKEPPEAAEAIAIWVDAKNTPEGRDKLSGLAPVGQTRVPEEFIIQPNEQAWPTYEIGVTLKNISNAFIQYSYSENGVMKNGTLEPQQIGPKPTKFRLSTTYMFNFKKGRKVESTTHSVALLQRSKTGTWRLISTE
ncbi:hypothetical protein HYPSUDRAFT_75161 [Hypholoma sublateritium FD-334 SS-4]|uniref:VWFA domain-containing protein n=1 Tax=Hypholoma sublateritium (strain FD-334 SS-4) TaxID=945553 RepID=A0A0D2PDV6_HYPSF|nr:hypothetical protein HYPSUDRAFT_75161 [Hypholoma sublateritium FD-334 SS-4]